MSIKINTNLKIQGKKNERDNFIKENIKSNGYTNKKYL